MTTASEAAEKIEAFLSRYAQVRPDYHPDFDDEDEQFTSPDASILFAAQKILETGESLPSNFIINSSWGSGGYAPYSDTQGKAMHDEIVAICNGLKKQ
jgi:hypothetical protein